MEMVASLDEFKSSQSVYGKAFPNFDMLDAKIASALIRSSKSPTSRRRSVPTRKTDRLHDLRLLSSDWRS